MTERISQHKATITEQQQQQTTTNAHVQALEAELALLRTKEERARAVCQAKSLELEQVQRELKGCQHSKRLVTGQNDNNARLLVREKTTSGNLTAAVTKAQSDKAAVLLRLNDAERKMGELDAENQTQICLLRQASDKVIALEEQVKKWQYRDQRQHDILRAYQLEQAATVERLKLEVKVTQQQFDRYLSPVDPAVQTPNQIRRLAYGVVHYMVDRKFSEQQMMQVLTKITADRFDPKASAEAITKHAKSRGKIRLANTTGDIRQHLANCSNKQLEDLLPQDRVMEIQQEGAQQFADALYVHWSILSCTNLKMTLMLSRRQWECLRRILFQRWDAKEGWCRLWCKGVRVPQPHSHTKIAQWMEDVAAEYDLTEVTGGHSAALDLKTHMTKMLTKELHENEFVWEESKGDHGPQYTLRSKLNQTKPIISFMFDAARSLKTRNTTAVAWKLANGSLQSHSPQYTHTVAVSEGNDEQDQLLAHLGGTFAEINGFIKNPTATVETSDVSCEVLACADQKAVHSNYGFGPCKAKFSCPLCYCPHNNFQSNPSDIDITPRTMEEIKLLAHSVVGDCTACGMKIVDKPKVECKGNETPLAKPGMKPPKVPESFAKANQVGVKKKPTWNDLHRNVIYGSSILLKLEPARFAICILHLNLRMVGAMMTHTMFRNLEGPAGDARAEELWKMLVRCGIPIRRIKKPNSATKVTDWYKTVTKHSFAGADAARVLVIWDKAMDCVYPEEYLRSASAEEIKRVETFKSTWRQYIAIWKDLNDLAISKEEKADRIEAKNVKFATTWLQGIGSTTHLYVHLLLAHVPQQLRDLPIDLWFLQTEGLEHCNLIRKRFAQLMSNGHKPGNQRILEVDSYINRFGTAVKAHTKFSGPALPRQLLQKTIVWEHVQREKAELEMEMFQLLDTPLPTFKVEQHERRKIKVEMRKKAFQADTLRQCALHQEEQKIT